jgi:FMN reductase
MEKVRILGLGGSLGHASSSLAALKIALEAAREEGADVELVDLRELELPMYVHETDAPAAAVRLADAFRRAQGLVWSSPLYHGSMSGAFKNALDWLELLAHDDPPYLGDRPVGLIASAGGAQALQGINSMELSVRALRGLTVPLVVPIARAWQIFGSDGSLKDAKVDKQLKSLGREVVRLSRKLARG